MRDVKLVGCRHSGTKYLERLLIINWRVIVNRKRYGHKHQMPENVPEDMQMIAISKHPAAYIASTRDRKWGFKGPSMEIIADWIKYHYAWLEITDDRGIAVRHEDLLFDFNNTMKQIEKALHLRCRRKSYQDVTKYCGDPNRKVKRAFYKNQEYLKLMNSKDREAIDSIPGRFTRTIGLQALGNK